MNRNSEVIGTCTIGYICDSNKYNKFVAKHKKIKKLYVHILHYEWVTHTHTYTHFFTHTCVLRTFANTLTHTRFIQMYHPTPPRTSPPHPQAQVMSSKLICLINACK